MWLETRGPWLLIGLVVADSVLGLNVFGTLYRATTGFIHVVVGV
jgi:hypothetical protein